MIRLIFSTLFLLVLAVIAYLLLWPVPIDPVAWEAPVNEGYTDAFAPNEDLEEIERIGLNGLSGPEDAAIGPDGRVYMATHEGKIARYDPATGSVDVFAETGGRPLGVEFSSDGVLYVADAYIGLLQITPEGVVTVLASQTEDGSPIEYADDLDIAPDGSIYFTDASTKFGAVASGGTLPGSFLELMEHGSNGRVLRYHPDSGKTAVVQTGLNFANGLAMTADGTHYLVIESVNKLNL